MKILTNSIGQVEISGRKRQVVIICNTIIPQKQLELITESLGRQSYSKTIFKCQTIINTAEII